MTLASRSLRRALLLLLGSSPFTGLAGQCPTDTLASSRICQAGVDALTLFLPVEGLLVSGGNPMPGTAGAVGKFGHLRIVGRVGLAQLTIPLATYDGTTDTVRADKRLMVPVPRLDLALGLFSKQLPMGTAAVDLLGSALLIPAGATSRIQIDENARTLAGLALGLGFGIRAAMKMAGSKPTISLSAMKRDMPAIRFGDLARGDRLSTASNLSAINVRLLAGGQLGMFTISGGAGMDLFKGTGSVSYADSTGADSTVAVNLSTSRIMTVLNLATAVGPLDLWVEGGFQVGKKTTLSTVFERNDASAGKFYTGFGAAIHF
jgi:hypothetical protein